ncbi:MAG: porin family protein [Oceanicaulis sp.]
MNRMLTIGAAGAVLAAAAGSGAQAQWMDSDEAGFYLEGGYAYTNLEPENAEDGLDTHGITARLGYSFSRMFAIETDLSTGLDDGDFDFNVDEDEFNFDGNEDGDLNDVIAVAGDIELNYLVGAYGKVSFPATDSLNVFGRAGYAYTDIDASVSSASGVAFTEVQQDADGPAFGAGLEAFLTRNWTVRADYTYYSFEETDTDQFALTLGYHF